MYNDRITFTRQPFQHDVDTAFFFPGGARGSIVNDIKTALAEGVPLITLTGTDGSGKTMICRKVEEDLGESCQVLFFRRGVESFDEVIEGISTLVETGGDEHADRGTRLEKIIETLKNDNRRLVVFIDGAESIFLATLERIRTMVDMANDEATTIQLVLSGQPLFLLNFKQLGIVSFRDIEERNYSLDPLDAETTCEYLNHCVAVASGSELDYFSPRMADRIMDTARGNFRLINRLADRYVTAGSLTDPEEAGFDDGTDEEESVAAVEENGRIHASGRLGNVDLEFLSVPRFFSRWYVIAGGIVALLLFLFLLLGGDEEAVEPVAENEVVPELRLDKVEPDPIEIPEVAEQQKPEPLVVRQTAIEPVEGQVAEVQAPERSPNTEIESPVAETQPAAEASVEEEQAVQEEPARAEPAPVTGTLVEQEREVTPAPPITAELEQAPPAVAAQNIEPPVAASQAAVVEPEPDQEKIAETQQIEDLQTDIQEQPESSGPVAAGAEIPSEIDVEQPELALPLETSETETVREEAVTQILNPPENAVSGQTVEVEPVAPEQPAVSVATETATVLRKPAEVPALPQRPEIQERPEQEVIASTDSIQIPELTVVTKKKQRTDAVPFTVVTLEDQRKRSPQAPAPVPKPEPVVQATMTQPPTVKPEEIKQVPAPAPEPKEAAVVSMPVSPQAVQPIQERPRVAAPQNSQAYYAERLAAGSRWLVGAGSGKYTVQLTALPVDQAERRLAEMLGENSYQPIKDQAYILRKAGQPQTVTLYFGEFASQEEARQAQQGLPAFLQDLNPSAVAVNDAVARARSSQ